MKSSKKIIFMLIVLIFAFIVSAAVVFATQTETVSDSHTKILNTRWEADDVTESYKFIGSGNSQAKRFGYIYAMIADNGNKYVTYTPKDQVKEYDPENGKELYNTATYLDFTLETETTVKPDTEKEGNTRVLYKYNPSDYPYIVYDFDIMTPTGTFGGATSGFSFRAYKSQYASSTAPQKKMKDTSKSPLQVAFSSFKSYLDATPYNWQHVTFVMKYQPELDENGLTKSFKYQIDIYVNGKYETTTSNTAGATDIAVVTGIRPDEIGFYSVRASGVKAYNGTKVSTSDPSYVANDPTTHFKDHISFDNNTISYYTGNYTSDQIAKERFNEDYELPYGRTVATVTDADGNEDIYDNFAEAFAAADSTNTLTLFENVDTLCVVNKAVKVNTNGFNFNYEMTEEYILDSSENGVLTFKYNDRIVKINWDVPCVGECNCGVGIIGHILTAESYVRYSRLPEYPGELPTFEVENGLVKEFLGWSYENDGIADEITAITAKQAELGEITLYPIYRVTQYSFEVITTEKTSYFLESEYTDAMKAVAAGGTIMLHTDVTVENNFLFEKSTGSVDATVTIDLNGHDFKRFSVCSFNYSAIYNSETGTYSKGAYLETKSGSAPNAFTISAGGINVTLKTSVPGANIYTYTLFRDAWLDEDGNVVGYDNVRDTDKVGGNSNSGTILFGFKGAKNTTINIEGNGLTYYGAVLVVNEWGGNQNTNTVNINGGEYYVVVDTYQSLIAQMAGGVVNVKDATLYCNGESFIRAESKVNESAVTLVDFTFTNCDIIDAYATNNNTAVGAAGIKLINCRYYASNGNSANNKITIYPTTKVISKTHNTQIAEGASIISQNFVKEIKAIAESKFVIGENDLPTFEFTKTTKTYSFDRVIVDLDEDCVLVNWIDTEGYLLDTTYALKNSTATIPSLKVPSGDGWRGVSNVTTWLGSNGTVSDLFVGENKEYDFFAVLPAPEEREYAGNVTNAMFNMVYFTNFAYNVYVPKEENVKITDFGGHTPTKTVWINGVEYWLCTVYAPSTKALDETVINLTYTIDGASYSVKFKPSALFYANVIVTDRYAEDDEKELVGCLIRYIEESYLAVNGGNMSEENQAKLDNFYSIYTPAPYTEEYPDASLFDSTVFKGLLKSIAIAVDSGKVKFIFTLTDSAAEANYKIRAKGLTSALCTEDGKVFTSENTPLRTHVMETFTISIVDENGNTVKVTNANGDTVEVTSKYSLAAYVSGTGTPLAKALYAFGSALRTYYPVDEKNYPINKITILGEDIADYTIAADIDDASEYFAAEQLQALIYTKSGYWLEIVPTAMAEKSIVLSIINKTGSEGFYVTVSKNRIQITCEYSALINEHTYEFFSSKLSGYGTVNFSESDTLQKNIRDVYYSQFGAVGDGITDDSEAIRAAHVYANSTRQTVCADPGATYYIGPMTSQINISSDVNWGNATFIIDDSVIEVENPARSIKVFNVTGASATTFNSKSEVIIAINAAGGIDADKITKLDLGIGYAALVQVVNADHKNYIRYGANANSGAQQQEMILIDEYGNIDPSTPFMFDYEAVTSIIARTIDATPITIEGGIFITRANTAPSEYTSYARNIQVTRPNTTVKNITHYVEGEGATGAPYEGFLKVHLAYNVTFKDCLLTGHKIYKNPEDTGMGTYDISATSSVNIRWINCSQTNFFSNEEKEETTKHTHWGIMGSSYCKNLSFDNCRLTRFDAHAGVYNVRISNCEIIHIAVVGGGTLKVENTKIFHNLGIQFRTDYGNFWHGDVILNNIEFRTPGSVTLFNCTWYNHDFGYATALPTNITIDGLTLKNNADVNLFPSSFVKLTNSIICESFDSPVLDAEGKETGEIEKKPNVNPMTAPKTVTIKNSNGYNIIIPDKDTYLFFKDTQFTIE